MEKEKTFEKYKIDSICMLIKIVNSKTYSFFFLLFETFNLNFLNKIYLFC